MNTPTAIAVILVVTVSIGCGSGSPSAPAPPPPTPQPTPAPQPQPQPQTFTLSGTVSESFPTASTRIAGAIVTFADGTNAGRTATTGTDGAFVIEGLQPGGFTVTATAPGFQSRSTGVDMSQNRTLNIQLPPVFREITETLSGSISGGDTICADSSIGNKPCKRHTFAVHNGGVFEADLDWAGSPDLDLELWKDGSRIANSNAASGRERVSVTTTSGTYQLRVVYYGGAIIANYTLAVRRPN